MQHHTSFVDFADMHGIRMLPLLEMQVGVYAEEHIVQLFTHLL
jgi:hypothetical protein